MSGERPDPDELLARAREEEASANRGRLTIFFGAAPGVGKTYAMLEQARSDRDLKRDVVVGIVETHGRYDTGALLIGLELLPRRKVQHRGVTLSELDLDAALARKPRLILIDELAHTNAPGSRHNKRWQDVEELLDAGIDVYTTLNVQHLESLNDVVAQITGVVVRETVPDVVLERAHDVKLIDLPPDDLVERLQEGKVYVGDQAVRAAENFFRKGNLIALRELALRRTAAQVDKEMDSYRRAHGIDRTWATGDRLLVCVSPSPASAPLIRAARRMAGDARAEWIAAYVETPAALRLSKAARDRVASHLRLAERLGAQTVTLAGENAAEATIEYARKRNVTRIVAGKPTHARWRDLLRPSFLEELVRTSGPIDVQIISGDEARPAVATSAADVVRSRIQWGSYAASIGVVVFATIAAWLMFGDRLADVVMVYLLGIVLVSMRFGYGPSLLAAVLSVVAYDFFFIPPYYTFVVADLRHFVTFAVMFFVAIVISSLTKRVREQADAARRRELRTSALYAMTRELASTRSVAKLLDVAARHLHDVFESQTAVLLRVDDALAPAYEGPHAHGVDEKEKAVADWVWRHVRPAGLTTDTLPLSKALYVPLPGSRGVIGVLGVVPADPTRFVDPDQRQLLETFASQIASAVERAQLAERARNAQLRAESDQLRNALLSSVSHDLRAPLAVVAGAASTLLEGHRGSDDHELVETIAEEAERLSRLVENLLAMTRLESGAVKLKKEWQPLEEVVGAALTRLERRLSGREVTVRLAPDLPLVPLDAVSIEQVLINLLENAIEYTPRSSPIEIDANPIDGGVEMAVLDRGPGIPASQKQRIFDKFERARDGKTGIGLGLTICRGIVAAHGGRVYAEDRPGGGAAFRFTLPVEGPPPRVDLGEPMGLSAP